MISSAQVVASNGDRVASTRELEAVLAEMKGSSGTAIDSLRPKILGMIGANHFHDGRIDEAREATRLALEACAQVGDEQGVSVYRQNLQLLETALTKDDAVVAQVARAQELSDQGRYEASNAMLEPLGLDAVTTLTSKVHGLLGANYFWMGDRAIAARHTQEAVRFAERIGDPDAVRVYGYNLTQIRNPENSLPANSSSQPA